MPELNFKITGDDAELKKTLANVAKYSKDANDQISKEIAKGVDSEVKAREKAVKVTQDQKSVSLEVVNSVNEEVKAIDKSTEAIKRKKAAFDAVTGLQIKPVQMTSSLDEVNASNSGKTGSITTGPVVGTAEEYNKAANQAAAFGTAAADANRVATDSTNKTTEAIKNAIVAEDSWKLKVQSYQNIKSSTTDPAVIAEYTKKIQEAQAEIAKLNNIGKRGYDELGNRIKSTIGQQEILTNRLKYFQDQLQFAKAPQSFVSLNRKIQETEEQLNRLANAGKKGFDDLGNKIVVADTASQKFVNTLKSIGAAILAAFSVQMIISWAKEARELAARGEGIREAFAKLDNGKTLQLLRTATRGATSDIDLMAAALRAKNFQIAPELLAKGLELAGKVSRQTGQDVTYLTDSFVNGLGRKSLLILDNLQISQVQLRAEIKKTGDFQTAVGNVVEAKLKSMGEVTETTADKMAQFATKIANVKELVGQKINLVLNYDAVREANKEFYETGLQVQSLQRNISPLLSKYDELSEKAAKNGGVTKLNKVEQSLMKDIIKQVGEEIPTAITQFDKYGNAISISTTRAKEFIDQQVLILQAINADRIEATTNKIDDLNRRIPGVKKSIDEIAKSGTFKIPETTSQGQFGGGLTTFRDATAKEVKTIVGSYQTLIKEKAKYEALLASDSGQLLAKRQKENEEFAKITKTDDGKAEEAERKAADKLRRAQERQDAADSAALSAQESLQQRIQVLKDKFERQGLTKEQEARQAIVDEFKKLAFDIEQQGKKYDEYAKKYGAAKALSVLGPKETTAQIEPIRKAALEDLDYRQETARFEFAITKQKDAYEAYENWKRMFGEASAKQRFADELDTSTTYLDALKDRYSKLIFKNVVGTLTGKNNLSGPEEEEFKAGAKRIEEAQKGIATKRDADYAEAYQAALTHSQKLERINKDFQKKAYDLRATITDDEKVQLNYQRDNLISAANDEYLARTAIYKKLSQETILLTRDQVDEQIKALDKILAAADLPDDVTQKIKSQVEGLKLTLKVGTDQANLNILSEKLNDLKTKLNATDEKGNSLISPDQKKQTLKDIVEVQLALDKLDVNGDGKVNFGDKISEQFKYLKGSTKEVAEGLSNDLGRAASGFSELSEALGGVDTEAGYALDTFGKLAQAGSDAAGAFASFSSGDIIGGVTKTISAVTSVLSIGKKVKEMNAAARQEVADYYTNAIAGEREYQEQLKERAILNAKNNSSALKGILEEVAIRKEQTAAYKKEADEIMAQLSGQSYVTGETYTHGTWFRKAKVEKTTASLGGKDFSELSQLLSQGKLEGNAKTLVERLVELEQKGYDADQAIRDLAESTAELFTGTTSDNLTNTLADMFKNGKASAQDLADFFKQTMDDAANSVFKNKVLAEGVDKFYQEFVKQSQSDGGLTDAKIADLQALFKAFTDDAAKQYEDLQKITGSDLSGSGTTSTDTLSGKISSITVDQADKLSGLFNGFRITQMETNEIIRPMGLNAIEQLNVSRSHLESALRIEANTLRTAENTGRLANIEKSLASMDNKIVSVTDIKQGSGYGGL